MIGSLSAKADQWRIFTDAKSGRTLTAKVASKNLGISKVELILKSGKKVWIDIGRLTEKDQRFVEGWEKNAEGGSIDIKMRANTVAMGATKTEWQYTWGEFDAFGGQIIHEEGVQKTQDRTLGIWIENRGDVEEFIIEVFWLGYVLRDKTQRVINSLSAQTINIPAGTLSEPSKLQARVGSFFNYREDHLVYLDFDFTAKTVEGFYVGLWQGYGYAGWAVRLSDTKGNIVHQSASQNSFLRYIKPVPVPTAR